MANRSLVTPDQEEKEHTLVPLVADFLRHHRPQIVHETGARLEQRAFDMIIENGYQKHDLFPTLDAAWPSLSTAIPLFLVGDNARLQTVCNALEYFLNFTGRWDEWLALSQKAEAKAIATGDHTNAGWRSYDMGGIASLRKQAEEVLIAADRATTHWKEAGDPTTKLAFAHQLRGIGHALKQDYPAAIIAYQEALDLSRNVSAESVDVAMLLNGIAQAESLSGMLTEADSHFREALRVACEVNDAEGIAIYTGNLASLALDRKDWLAAENMARQALPLSEKLGRQELIALNCHHFAKALLRQNKAVTLEALLHARRAVEIFGRLGSPSLADAQAILAECVAAAPISPFPYGMP